MQVGKLTVCAITITITTDRGLFEISFRGWCGDRCAAAGADAKGFAIVIDGQAIEHSFAVHISYHVHLTNRLVVPNSHKRRRTRP